MRWASMVSSSGVNKGIFEISCRYFFYRLRITIGDLGGNFKLPHILKVLVYEYYINSRKIILL